MAASQEQKVDFLLKKIGYVASKTGIAEDESSLTGTKKAPFGEAIPSPLVVPATNIWSDSSLIPGTPPGTTGATVRVYLAGTSGHQMTADSTISGNRTFIAYSTYNNTSTGILGNWIDTSFGADYIVKVYKGDPNSGGVQLSAAGSGSNDTWFFDYSSGVLNFNGTSVPSGVTSSNIYIVGYRYVGGTGISPTAGFGTFASLNVSGISTFAGLVDANGGVTANTLIVEDLTDNRVVLAGTGGEIEDSANLTFDGSTLVLTGDQTISGTIDVDGRTELDTTNISETLNVVGIATFANNIDANGDLDVNGRTELDVTNISETLNVVGISTFTGNIDANGDLDVDGRTELDTTNISETLNVTGIATFASNIDANGDLDVDGRTELDVTNISETLSVTGIATFVSNIDANGDLDVDGRTELDDVNISETLSVTGISTFTGAIDANGDLDVDGHTELDDVNISGVATATAFHTGAEGSAIRITSNTISGPAELFIDPAGVGDNTGAVRIKGDLYVDGTQTIINSTTIELADFVVGIATTATSDAVANGAGIKIGPDNTFLYDHPNTSLKSSENINLASSKTYKIDGTDVLSATTLGSGVVNSSLTNLGTLTSLTISGNLDVDGYAELDDLNVSGISTFASNIDANGNLDVDGYTELDDLNVSGISTFAGEIDANGRIVGAATNNVIPFLYSNLAALPSASTYHGAFAHVHSEGKAYYAHAAAWYELVNKEINGVVGTGTERYNIGFVDATNLDISGVSTFTGNADFNGNVDIDGHTELDYINVSAASTFAGLVDINAGGQADTFKVEDLTSGRVVLAGTGGEIEDSANLTFNGTLLALTGNQTISGTIDVDGLSNFDDILVSAASTFTGNIDANGDLDVDGRTELDTTNISETLNVVGIATFASNIDANGNLDVDGYTELDDLNVTGVSTFAGLVDINAGGQASTFKVEDLTDNRVVISGTGGELEDDSNLTFNGTTLAVGVNLDVDGQTDLDVLNVAEGATFSDIVYLNGTVSAASSTGANGQVLQSTGIGVTWATLPTARTNSIQTATQNQTTFNFNYNVGYLDVFYNGVKLSSSEFTASNGTTVVLGDVAYAGDIVEFISYNTVSTGGGGGGGGAASLNELSDVTITGTPVAGETLQHNGTAFVNDYITSATTTSTSQFTLMSLDLSVYRSIEYQIQVTEGSNFHVTKILAIHNGTAAIHNEYGTLSTNTSVASFDVDISGNNIRLLATPASTNSTAFKVKFTAIKV